MARGTVMGERVVSQASTDAYREGHERALGERQPARRERAYYRPTHPKANRNGFVYASDLGGVVDEPVKCGTTIMADRVHEGVTFDDGERVRDLGSRAKRRQFLKETGLAESSDFGPGYHERQRKAVETHHDRVTDRAFDAAARKLYNERKLRD